MKKLLISLVFFYSLGVICISAAVAAPAVTFQATDDAGSWFECTNTESTSSIGCVPEGVAGTGEKSLAVIRPGDSIGFASLGQANTLHTAVSLMFPTKAKNMPFDVDLDPPLLGGSALRSRSRSKIQVCTCSSAISIPTCSPPSLWTILRRQR